MKSCPKIPKIFQFIVTALLVLFKDRDLNLNDLESASS